MADIVRVDTWLRLRFQREAKGQAAIQVLDVTALATAMAMDFAYTGRLTG